jgi:hypothetical protein
VTEQTHHRSHTFSPDEPVPAGDFSSWLQQQREALHGTTDMAVACVGCCSSSYFIHIKPGERASLSRIPDRILFPAPEQFNGHWLMGYDDNGHCPMLENGKCAIYAHRPQTCRNNKIGTST